MGVLSGNLDLQKRLAERLLKERDLNEKFEHRIDYQLMKVHYILLTDGSSLSLFPFLFYQTNLKF